MLRTILVDDHAVFRIGLRLALERMGGIEVVGEAASDADARSLATQIPFDVAIVDLHLGEGSGVELTRWLRAQHQQCRVIAVSADSEPMMISQVVDAGAHGYCPKTDEVTSILDAVRAIGSGHTHLPADLGLADAGIVQGVARLSPREREVLGHLCEGKSNDDIATSLFLSRRTVETHRQRIMNKLGAHTIAELVTVAARLGIGG